MTQTKNSRQQLKDQDDLSPGQQQSEWMAWPLNDQLVGWSNERLGCIDSTQATQVWWVLICFPGFLMTEWLQLKSEERSFLSCRKESDKDRQTGRSSQHVFCSIGQFSMSSSVGKKRGWLDEKPVEVFMEDHRLKTQKNIQSYTILYTWFSTCRFWLQENSNRMAFYCRIAPGACCWWDVVWKLSLICCLTCWAMLCGIWNRSIPTIYKLGVKKRVER